MGGKEIEIEIGDGENENENARLSSFLEWVNESETSSTACDPVDNREIHNVDCRLRSCRPCNVLPFAPLVVLSPCRTSFPSRTQ